jgi:hypothetical protein
MEATVTAPFGGVVAAVLVAANAQIDAARRSYGSGRRRAAIRRRPGRRT